MQLTSEGTYSLEVTECVNIQPEKTLAHSTAPEGYSTGVVNANKNRHTAHHAGPLSLELVGLSKVAVDAGVQQADNSCYRKERC